MTHKDENIKYLLSDALTQSLMIPALDNQLIFLVQLKYLTYTFFFFSHLALSPRLRRLTLKARLWHQGLPW